MEPGALTYFTFDPQATAVYLDKMFGDGQAEACAARFAGARHIDAVKALKDARLIGLRYADAGIGDGEDNLFSDGGRAEHDLSARKGVLNGVVQKVLQDFGETPAVTGDIRQTLGRVHRNSQVFFRGAPLGRLEAAFDQLRDAEPANLELEALGVHLGKHEEVFGQASETAGMLENDLKEARAVLRIVDGAGEKRF